MKCSAVLLALGIALANAPLAVALDPNLSSGVSGHSMTNAIAGGRGFATVGVNSLLPSISMVSSIGVPAIGGGGTNRGSVSGYQSNGTTTSIASKGGSTSDVVPGRAPTYNTMVGGRSGVPVVGGIMP